MNKSLLVISFVSIILFIVAPLVIYCQNVNLKNTNSKTGSASNSKNLPLVVQDTSGSFKHSSGELTKIDNRNDFIYLNTMDGLLYAVSKHDGKIKWSMEEEAVLKFPENYENPYFLTDPRDGSLYIFTSRSDSQTGAGGLKKFPYTIAELVSASPSKSSDGFLYTGDKKDQWLAIDYRTGAKLDTLTAETLSSKISIADDNVIFIGRTQYTITMFDISTRRKIFNLTYYDYSTHAHASQQSSRPFTANVNQEKPENLANRIYPYYHFTSSSDGTIVTLDRKTGDLLWKLKLKSPIIAMYRYENEQLFKIQFAIYAVEALDNLNPESHRLLYAEQKYQDTQVESSKPPVTGGSNGGNKFLSTLYIGFHKNNLYALPALVYNWQSLSIGNEPPPLLTDGKNNDTALSGTTGSLIEDSDTVSIGHHRLPDKFDPPPDYIQPNDKLIVISSTNRDKQNAVSNVAELFSGTPLSCPVDTGKGKTGGKRAIVMKAWRTFDDLMQNKYVWTIFTVLLASIPPLMIVFHDRRKKKREKLKRLAEKQERQESSKNGSLREYDDNSESSSDSVDESPVIRTPSKGDSGPRSRTSSSKHSNSSQKKTSLNETSAYSHIHPSQSAPAELGTLIQVGKITYDTQTRLGHGCSGTIVYRGTFESRPVAVKRLLPECYTLADREVSLLRDADQHPNVLRYFCTESDSQFRYIALELCQMTLADYVHQQFNLKHPPKNELRILNILEQATCGLDHLHSLDIVHRDIKPQNVLLSFPDAKGRVFVMISDFGLCKRLEVGNNSFSKRSGILGTEGWIAPEVLDDLAGAVREQLEDAIDEVKFTTGDEQPPQPKRITKAVDIFSMGCVYYFVLSGGSHPFGDSIMRQANILQNQFKLDKLTNSNCEIYMQRVLIEKMISNDPKRRPTTKEILSSPVFWSKAKILQFLQDVSDRIEKLEANDPILVDLEKGASAIIRNNWKVHICSYLQNDLKRYRTYNGVVLRDLLRAIRNKKHHYRELPPEVMQSLGSLPDEFVDYFINRFPKMINHVYDVMKCCSNESMLDVYYNHTENRF